MSQSFKMPADVMAWSREDDRLKDLIREKTKKENRKVNLFGFTLLSLTIFLHWVIR